MSKKEIKLAIRLFVVILLFIAIPVSLSALLTAIPKNVIEAAMVPAIDSSLDYWVSKTVIVKTGDSLYSLAEQEMTPYHNNIKEIIYLIRDLNKLPNYTIEVGQQLIVPVYSK